MFLALNGFWCSWICSKLLRSGKAASSVSRLPVKESATYLFLSPPAGRFIQFKLKRTFHRSNYTFVYGTAAPGALLAEETGFIWLTVSFFKEKTKLNKNRWTRVWFLLFWSCNRLRGKRTHTDKKITFFTLICKSSVCILLKRWTFVFAKQFPTIAGTK